MQKGEERRHLIEVGALNGETIVVSFKLDRFKNSGSILMQRFLRLNVDVLVAAFVFVIVILRFELP